MQYGTALRIYDNGGKTFDRFTIIPPRWALDWFLLSSVGCGFALALKFT